MENYENVNYSKSPKKKRNIVVLLLICLFVFSLLLNLNFIFSPRGTRNHDSKEMQPRTVTAVDPNENTYNNIRTVQVRVLNADIQVETESSHRNAITINIDSKNPQDYSIDAHGANLTLECQRLPLSNFNFLDDHIDILVEYNDELGSEFILDQLNIQNISGDIFVSGLSSDMLFLQSTSGSIDTEDILAVSGLMSTTSGKVSLTDASFRSDYQGNTVSGGLFLDDVTAASTTLNTISGKIDCEDFGSQSLTSKSISGSQSFDFNELSDVVLLMESVSGNIDVNFEEGTQIKNTNSFKSTGDFQFDSDGSSTLRCNTTSGTITVN